MAAITLRPVNLMEEESSAIARGLRARDPEIIDRLIERYQYRLFRYLVSLTGSRDTAADIFQETWVRVLERGYRYDGKSGFDCWLFTVARNLYIDKIKRKKTPVSLEECDPAALDPAREPSPLEEMARDETSRRVSRALERLPPVCREALLLRFQEEMPMNEIARVVAAPLSTVKSRIYRGLETVRLLLEGSKP